MIRLKKILKKAGITQRSFAETVNINPARISLICSGKDLPRPSEIPPIEDYFLVPIDELIEKESRHA